jgi:DNA-binding transcriptional LysR family regulator
VTLLQLRVFAAAVEHGSLTRAAQALDMAQSTVSFHLAALEDALGVALLQRGRAGVRTTAAGARLAVRARQLLGLAEQARQEVQSAELAGELVVHASTVPAAWLLPAALAELRRQAPMLRVSVRVSASGPARRALLEGLCDVAVIGIPPADARLEAVRIGEDRVVLVGRPADGAPTDLEAVPLIVRESQSGTRQAVEHLVPAGATRLEVGSAEAVRRCVLEGMGVAFLSELAVAEDLAAGPGPGGETPR